MTRTPDTPAPVLQPRTTPQIIDAAFALARRHYWVFVVLAGLFHLPVHVFRFLGALAGTRSSAVLSGPEPYLGPAWWYAWNSLAIAAVIVAALRGYLHGAVDVGWALSAMRRRLARIVLVSLLARLIIDAGLFLLLVPGIFAFARLIAAVPLVADEGMNPVRALRRSVELTRGNVRKILLSAGLVALGSFLVDNTLPGFVGQWRSPAAAVLFDFLLDSALYPLIGVVTTVLYYDLRIQREAYDIELLMARMPENGSP
jgi:hypothetical protein